MLNIYGNNITDIKLSALDNQKDSSLTHQSSDRALTSELLQKNIKQTIVQAPNVIYEHHWLPNKNLKTYDKGRVMKHE